MIVPGQPAPLVKAALVSFLAGTARVVRDVPNTFDFKANIPVVLVADDSGPLYWPVYSKNTVRVTVFGNGIDAVEDLAGRCAGHLHDNVPAGLSHIKRNGTGVLVAKDPKTGADMASFTVTATVRTANTV